MREAEVKKLNDSNIDQAPSGSGIYAIYDNTVGITTTYIGRSNNIRRRLTEHYKGRGSKEIKMLLDHKHELSFSFSLSSNSRGAEAAEIERLLPVGNKRREIKQLEDF
jgi:excinuclease UvrABC nuclease subunit